MLLADAVQRLMIGGKSKLKLNDPVLQPRQKQTKQVVRYHPNVVGFSGYTFEEWALVLIQTSLVEVGFSAYSTEIYDHT